MHHAMRVFVLCMIAVLVVTSLPAQPARAATLVVTKTADDGSNGTLRWAIQQANSGDTITFDIPTTDPGYQASGGYWRIVLSSRLEITKDNITIDGTVPSGGTVPKIELVGNLSALFIKSSNNTVRGLIVNGITFGFDVDGPEGVGIVISGLDGPADNNVVEYNYLGTNYNGTQAIPNDEGGLAIVYGASNNIVRNNVISGNNGYGVYVGKGPDANDTAINSGNRIENNMIGLNAAGSAGLANETHGVELFDNAVDTIVGPGNVISGNGGGDAFNPHYGVKIIGRLSSDSTPISGNQVIGNIIGMNKDGTSAIPNTGGGVKVGTSRNTKIGAAGDTNRNVIAGNSGPGVLVDDQEPGVTGARDGIQITNNWIGLNKSGTGSVQNSIGVILECGATGVTVGPDNVISGNASGGGMRIRNTNQGGGGITTGPNCDKPAQNNVVVGNKIGTNPNGDPPGSSNPFRNFFGIIVEEGASSNTIGGAGANDGNLIAGNEFFGIAVGRSTGSNDAANNNVIQGNRIEVNGTLGNSAAGILIRNNASNNRITRTATTGNAGPGIDLTSGGNTELSAPGISNPAVAANLTLTGSISGGTNCGSNSCVVEVFDSTTRENEEGPRYIASFNTSGSGAFSVSLSECRPYLTFTITDQSNNTAPFTNAFGPFDNCNAATPTFGVSFTPSSLSGGPVAPGVSIQYSYTLQNTGNQPDTYDLVGSSSTPGVTFGFSPPTPITLAAGEQTTVVVTVNIPVDASGTSVASSVTATSRGDPSKQATVNQTTSLETAAQPELTPATRTGEGDPGEQVSYDFTLENVGNGAGSFTLSVSGLPAGWSASLTPNSPVGLDPGETATIQLGVTIPASADAGATGTATLTASADGNSDTATATTTVLLVPGLTFTAVPPQDRSAGAGQVIDYQYTLRNDGNGQDTFTIAVTPPSGWSFSVLPGTSVTLNKGESRTITVRLSVPPSATPDTYLMTVRATSNSDSSVTEELASTTTVVDAPVPQLSIEPPQSANPGQVVTFTHTITNVGSQDGTFNLAVADAPAGWSIDLSETAVTLTSGASTPLTVTVTSPAGTFAGDYTFRLEATATDANAATTSVLDTVSINQVADLSLTPETQASLESPDTVVTYTFTLENNGNFTDTVSLAATSSQGWDVSTVPSGTVELAPAASQPIDVVVSIPPGQVAGLEATITITATSSAPGEQATASAVTTIDEVPGAKLLPDVAEVAGLPSEPVTITFTLLNSGSISQTYALTLTDVPETPTGWVADVTPATTPSLAPGEAISVEVVLQAPEPVEEGTFDITLQATSSPDGATDTAIARLIIGTQIDVEISPEQVSGQGWNEPVRYTFNVTNTGRISETFTVDVVSLLGWETFGSSEIFLDPGESTLLSVAVVVPYVAAAGSVDTTTVTVSSQQAPNVEAQAMIETTARQAAGVNFSPNDVRPPVPGQEIRFQHTVVNIGNGIDGFIITATQDLNWPITIEPVTTPNLRRGGSFPIEVRVRVPGDVSTTAFNRVIVRATSKFDPSVYDEVFDFISPVQRLTPPERVYLPLAGR